MSEENVEVVRRAWQAFISGGVEATLEGWTEDCVFEEFPEMPESAVYVGRDRLSEAVEHFTEMWSDLVWEPLEFIDAGENLVIAVVRYRGRGRASGAPLDALASWLYEMRDGRVSRARAFTTKQQALEAAGLPE
jgi:ketosteroid isomerase-like protein